MPEHTRKTSPTEVSPTLADTPVDLPPSPSAETPVEVPRESAPNEKPLSIEKPKGSGLARFKSTNLEPEKVETLLTGLPHYPMSAAKFWVSLHPDEAAYWSDEYCFVDVPVQGQKDKTLHLIMTDLARKLPPGRVQKFRLALASKPHDVFFLAHVPSRNLDNEWNKTNLQACEQAKKLWTMVATRERDRGLSHRFLARGEGGQKAVPRPPVAEGDARRAHRSDLHRPHDPERNGPRLAAFGWRAPIRPVPRASSVANRTTSPWCRWAGRLTSPRL